MITINAEIYPPTLEAFGVIGLVFGIFAIISNYRRRKTKNLSTYLDKHFKIIYALGAVLGLSSIFFRFILTNQAWSDLIIGFPFCVGSQDIVGIDQGTIGAMFFSVTIPNIIFWFLIPQTVIWVWARILKMNMTA